MKATLTALAALLVSTIPLRSASAQGPESVMPAGLGYAGGGYPIGPVASAPTGGCDSCGKPSLWGKLGLKSGGCDSCGGKLGLGKLKGGCGKDGCGCGGGPFKQWLCKPYPSNAPVLKKAEYPLGFPSHPYARSPRDYFMWNDP